MTDKQQGWFNSVLIASLGGGLEYYDFAIFAIFAPAIAVNFFPTESPLVGLFYAFSALALGFISRPIGAIIFSHIGDKYGRKPGFIGTVILMSLATLAMAVLPSYHYWGTWSTVSFVLLRLCQGLSFGGELPGAYTYISEHSPSHKGRGVALVLVCMNIGLACGQSLHHYFTLNFSSHFVETWGWRIAFGLGGFLGLISAVVRCFLKESHLFDGEAHRYSIPFKMLVQYHLKATLKSTLVVSISAATTNIYLMFLPSYLEMVLNKGDLLSGRWLMQQLWMYSLATSVFAVLSDYLKREHLLWLAGVYLTVAPYFIFTHLASSYASINVLLIINAVGMGAFAGVVPSFIITLFPTSVRYTGVACSYNVAYAIFGGLVTLGSSWWVSHYQWRLAPAYLLSITGILALLALVISVKKVDD